LNNDVQAEDCRHCYFVGLSVSVAIIHSSSLKYAVANAFLGNGDEGRNNGDVTGITLHVNAVVENAKFEEQKKCDLRKKMKSRTMTFLPWLNSHIRSGTLHDRDFTITLISTQNTQ
jgi:hypothetical protein